jgi:MerR family copper efflux transcriptional regulator
MTMSIGQLAAHFGLATHVLRHWEAVGLLSPAARVGGRRRYHRDQIGRVAMIVRGKQVGFSLAELREMIEAPDPEARRALLGKKLDELNRLHDQIVASRAMIDHAISCPAHDFTQCPNFQRLIEEIAASPPGELPAAFLANSAPHPAHVHAAG